MSTPCGIVVIDKPAGPSSHEVVAWVRWALRLRTVGHCGTLDPPATGVLVVCVGEATKLAGFLVEDDKHYDARIVLGRATTTGDAHGETVATAAVPHDAIDRALAILPAWIGHHAWSPPSVSAVQQDGVRAHARVRAGEVFALPSRDMVVHALRITAVCREAAAIELALHVGKGTYVRTIATELGAALGVPAHLAALRRTAAGRFGLDGALTGLRAVALPPRPGDKPRVRVLGPAGAADDPEAARAASAAVLLPGLRPPAQALPDRFAAVTAGDPSAFERLCQGQRLAPEALAIAPWPIPDVDHLLVAPPPGLPAPALAVVARLLPAPDGAEPGAARLQPVRVLGPAAPAPAA